MPIKDPEKRKEYHRLWIKNRRNEFFKDKHCVRCFSKENLNLDHIDRTQKIDHRIWSWREDRRLVELDKCQVLCQSCHKNKTIFEDMKYPLKHNRNRYREGCRCNECKKDKVISVNEWRWKTGRRRKRS